MLIVVTGVSSMVHVYSVGYMAEDPSIPRFMSYLSLFTFFMLMLVTSDNLVQLFFGWEGVGLASYLLIGFWYDRPSANAAAIKAFIVNRVGDFGFALGIFAVWMLSGSSASTISSPRRRRWPPGTSCSSARRCRRSRPPACCCSSAPWASRPSSACTPGCRTRWKARPRSPP